jgi:hypothetical protein
MWKWRDACRVLMGKSRKRRHLERPSLDRSIITKRIFEKWNGSMDWIDLAQNRDRWMAVVNAVMNSRLI